MKTRFTLIITLLFALAGLLLFFGPYKEYMLRRSKLAPARVLSAHVDDAISSEDGYLEGTPVRIHIPSLAIDLNVIDGYYNTTDKTWTLTRDSAQFATITSKPNNTHGNTFIYGHNISAVFGRLSKIKAGDQAIVYTSNGRIFTYTFRSSIVTNPYDDTLFQYKGVPILTLQTCSGVWSQNRQLFTFDFYSAI